jgi:hypothetical protein
MRLWLALFEDVPVERVEVASAVAHAIQRSYLDIGREQGEEAARERGNADLRSSALTRNGIGLYERIARRDRRTERAEQLGLLQTWRLGEAKHDRAAGSTAPTRQTGFAR